MIPYRLLGTGPVPGSDRKLTLYQHDQRFTIRVDGVELMSSDAHGSEDALADLTCARFAGKAAVRMLIGGLGMGYTVASALGKLGPAAEVHVAELVPQVVTWNRGPLAHLASSPLSDPRVRVIEGDVVDSIRGKHAVWDAIVLDVDNGPSGLTSESNNWLYNVAGLRACLGALCPSGVLSVWSADPSPPFVQRLRQTGFAVTEHRVRVREDRGGVHHVVWVATRQE